MAGGKYPSDEETKGAYPENYTQFPTDLPKPNQILAVHKWLLFEVRVKKARKSELHHSRAARCGKLRARHSQVQENILAGAGRNQVLNLFRRAIIREHVLNDAAV